MYNGIGLQTARGSGTNGYVQTNKFFVRARDSKVGFDGNKGYGPDQGMAGLSKKPNTEILEHDRKRQIELKVVILEDELSEKGFTDAQIAVRVDELREKLEAEAAASGSNDGSVGAAVSDVKMSDTQTHQVAARKDKQMEKLRDAFGFSAPEAELIQQGKREELEMLRKGVFNNDSEREEGEFLSGDEDMKIGTHQDELKAKHKGSKKKPKNKRKGRRGSDSSESESSQESGDSESDSDRETKKKKRSTKTTKKVVRSDSSDSGSESDEPRRGHVKAGKKDSKAPKRHDSGSESDSSRCPGHRTTKTKQHIPKPRHDSDSDNERDNDRWKSSPTPDRELKRDSYKSKTNGSDYRKHEDEHHNRSIKSDKLAHERTQRRERRDDKEFDVPPVQKKEQTLRRGRHDSENDDSDIERSRNEYVKSIDDRKAYQKGREEKMTKNDRKGDVEADVRSHRGQERKDDHDHDSDIERSRNEYVKSIDDRKAYQKGREEKMTKNDRKGDVEADVRSHRGQERKDDHDHERAKHERRGEDGSHKKKADRDEDRERKLEKIEEDEYRGKKRERREENEERDVKRGRREEGRDGGRRENREEEKHGDRPREMREIDKEGGRRVGNRDRTKEMKEGDVNHERWDGDKDGGRREKKVEEELGSRREVKERDSSHSLQERKERTIEDKHFSKDTGRKGKREEERNVEDKHFSKKRERQAEDEERIMKRKRNDDEEDGSRNWDKRGQEKSRDERKEKDNREGKEDEHRGRRYEDTESSRRHQSDDVRKRR